MIEIHKRHPAASALAAALALALIVGCGGGGATADLAGQVTIGGKPIPADAEARIGFKPAGAGDDELVAVDIESGRYEAKGVPVGEVVAKFSIIEFGPPKFSERVGAEIREETSLVPIDKAGGVEISVTGDNPEQDFDL